MPVKELSFVITLPTFGIVYETYPLLQNVTRSFSSIDSPSLLFFNYKPLYLHEPIFTVRVVFHMLYLWNKVGDPRFFLHF